MWWWAFIWDGMRISYHKDNDGQTHTHSFSAQIYLWDDDAVEMESEKKVFSSLSCVWVPRIGGRGERVWTSAIREGEKEKERKGREKKSGARESQIGSVKSEEEDEEVRSLKRDKNSFVERELKKLKKRRGLAPRLYLYVTCPHEGRSIDTHKSIGLINRDSLIPMIAMESNRGLRLKHGL